MRVILCRRGSGENSVGRYVRLLEFSSRPKKHIAWTEIKVPLPRSLIPIEPHDKQKPFSPRLKSNAHTGKHTIDSRIMFLLSKNIEPEIFSVGIVLVPDREIILIDLVP